MDAVEHQGPLVDPNRTACLCDVGAPGYALTVAVDHNGNETLWIIDNGQLGVDGTDHGNPNQPHEKPGELPQTIRERIRGDRARCGRPRADGKPCRAPAPEPGRGCYWHQDRGDAMSVNSQVWPRAICPHCGKDCALGPKTRRITPHYCRCESCRPFNYLDVAIERIREYQPDFPGESGCDYQPPCTTCRDHWNHWVSQQIESELAVGFPCVMVGEVVPDEVRP